MMLLSSPPPAPPSSTRVSSPAEILSSPTATTPYAYLNVPVSPAEALLTHTLPAIGQLQLSVWRSQLADEVRGLAGQMWPGISGAPPSGEAAITNTAVVSPASATTPTGKSSSTGAWNSQATSRRTPGSPTEPLQSALGTSGARESVSLNGSGQVLGDANALPPAAWSKRLESKIA
ncbi:unnamed protein product [Protopolystoma xenopodis]|uniref:Uncharacterized protein n=1 Tax=Protopolystoma xenopodis TaxID=117903 RepID=A0A448WVN3_9PLAT|nr:unnamed protein product [Protopolystoma xenopodis]